jgi:predicted SAM-dependent methyltransferase
MKLVNLGCGNRYHSDWINIDMVATGPGVMVHDLSTGIPLDDRSCDMVYHSHVIEHIRREHILAFMRECCRVLKPGGVLRIVTPNLEQIAINYLRFLSEAVGGDRLAERNYDWTMLEFYDQAVRERMGGEMLMWLTSGKLENEAYVFSRGGEELRNLASQGTGKRQEAARPERLSGRITRFIASPLATFRRVAVRKLMTLEDRRALQIGQFRLSGEVHQWMYDRFSLARLMHSVGLVDPVEQTATTSRIGGWQAFQLDTDAATGAYKPDSFYMEASRPV